MINIEDYLNKHMQENKPIVVMSFFEEIPVWARVKVLEIDPTTKNILLEGEPKLVKACNKSGELFFRVQSPERQYHFKSNVLYASEKGIEVSFPVYQPVDKFSRRFLRVKPSLKKPVIVKVILKNEKGDVEEEILTKAIDICEMGIAIPFPKGKAKKGDLLNLEITLPNGYKLNVLGKVVRKLPLNEKEDRLGISFVNIDLKDQDEIAKYVFVRQQEIAQEIRE
ncbi:MAG TPA: PilZ domain-containing protein [Desulfurobacteriaceae bacterium]|nr:PilZ domain-containing protein [Desulfurobacteriaceae bacterium]